MKFYDRVKELEALNKIKANSLKSSRMTVVMGRRRVGKTVLINKVFNSPDTLYFFVNKKNESLLCAEYIEEMQIKLGKAPIGSISSFKDLFLYIIELAKERPITLIIDEFQEFLGINASIYGDMQHYWDLNKDKAKLNLILCGSVYSLMKKIFEGYKEPLFGRATSKLHVKPFSVQTLKEIMIDYRPKYKNDDLLALYLLTGGVAKYVEILAWSKAFTLDAMLREVFSFDSQFIEEGRNMLIEEFGKDYKNYFSILSLIAASKTSRSDIESILGMPVGGYLDHLENDYSLISRVRPILSKPGSRKVKYRIEDNFLNFWFRFIYKYSSAIQIGNFDFVKNIIKRDYDTFSGIILERYFCEKLIAEENLSAIGSWWEKGNQNEIDIVGINEIDKRAIIVEVKRNPKKIKIDVLKQKAVNLVKQLPGYSIEYRGLSIRDM
ncbi:MAG: ATP-binding protein [Spirochaetaceae bacterium]|jgi:AAA+ ATPase superfamily predicted ATPase|nr:ATP-binding protein [Spirochaetaceae bacterium]